VQRYTNFIASTTATNSTLTVLSNASCVVYIANTLGAATLYSDNGVTPLANPFLSSATGRIDFYAANGRYDVVVSKVGYLTVTISDIELDDLLAPSGSNSVGYLPAGAGAVATTVQTKLRESVSVLDFGAVGDGVTDDTAAIQAALNLGAFHLIYFPAGTYVASSLTCGADIALVGDGRKNSTIKFKAGSAGALLTANNAVHFTMINLGLDGNQANCPLGTQCLRISGVQSGGTGFSINGCGFYNAKLIGLYQTGTYSKANISNCVFEANQTDGLAVNATNALIEGNVCADNGRFGILAQGNYAQILGNTCSSNGQLVTSGAGIGVVNCSYPVVSGNTCLSNGTGAFFSHGIQFNTAADGVMSGNFSQGNNGSGLDIFTSARTTCTGNQTLSNKLRGIECDTTSSYSTIDGNVVTGNYEIGISVYNTIGTIVSNNSVIGNGTLGTVTNPLTAVANLPYGISLWGAGNYGNYSMVLGNQISQNIGSGANGVGLFIDAACVSVQLLGNSFAANTTQTTSVKANFAFVRDNQNVYTQQRGIAVLGAALTAVAVTFSPALTYAPDCAGIKVQFTSMPTANTGPFSITAISAAGFTINTYAAPGGAGVTIDWAVSVFA